MASRPNDFQGPRPEIFSGGGGGFSWSAVGPRFMKNESWLQPVAWRGTLIQFFELASEFVYQLKKTKAVGSVEEIKTAQSVDVNRHATVKRRYGRTTRVYTLPIMFYSFRRYNTIVVHDRVFILFYRDVNYRAFASRQYNLKRTTGVPIMFNREY